MEAQPVKLRAFKGIAQLLFINLIVITTVAKLFDPIKVPARGWVYVGSECFLKESDLQQGLPC